jgi:antirestriction protein ArdC
MNIYADVTNKIVAELESGAAPWVKAWKSTGADHNAFSLRPYRGINRMLLAMAGVQFSSNKWATFKQWSEAGGSVKKGSKGTHIVFFKPVENRVINDKGDEEISKYAMLRTFVVFNADQVDGIQFDKPAATTEQSRNEVCESTISKTGAVIKHGGDAACYVPSADIIRMPNLADFESAAHYYATAFHELTHWTGAKSRLDRDLSGRFGNPDYAFEELVAELGAAFLCADHGIEGDLRHAGYIQSWIKCLKENEKAIFKAAALAEKAADFIQQESEVEELVAA